MGYTITIKNRLNWIDWAKALAIFFVVFGHIPEERGSFMNNYITLFHMPLFFFISGYLTKKEFFNTETLKKYWYTLIIPYLCYNILFYPYWLVRHITRFPDSGWFEYVKPFIGTLMFQIPSPISSYLNGVTWFIAALLIMKIILSVCNKHQHGWYLLTCLVLLDIVLYVLNEQYRFTNTLPTVGFLKCFPFYIIGHICKQRTWISETPRKTDIIYCIGGITISIMTLYVGRATNAIDTYGICFWTICITAILGILSLCKLMHNIELNIIKNISIGTIVIMGLHWILLGTTNILYSKIMHVQEAIYPLWGAITLSILFMAILYPIIILFKNKYPFMLGKWNATRQKP